MREYKLSKGYVALVGIGLPGMNLALLVAFARQVVPDMEADPSALRPWILILIFLAVSVLVIALVVEAVKGKFVVDHEKVYRSGVLPAKQLWFDEIKGYRITGKYILLEPFSKEKKRIKISTYYAGIDELKEWLSAHYKDLDLRRKRKEKIDILNNKAFGKTTQERRAFLNKARKVTKILNWSGAIAGGLFFLVPEYYTVQFLLCLVVPIVILVALKAFKGLIRVDDLSDPSFPTATLGLILSIAALAWRALHDFHIVEAENIYWPAGTIAVIMLFFLFTGEGRVKLKKADDFFTVVVFALIFTAYGYGTVLGTNGLFDTSTPEVYKSQVLAKRTSTGKHTSYYFFLSPWGTQNEPTEISVPGDLYKEIEQGESVTVYFKEGWLNIPWFQVKK